MSVKLSAREFLEVGRLMAERDLPVVPVEELRLPELVKALSDHNRLKIVMALADGEFHEMLDLPDLDVQKSTLSHHLRTLREAGFTETSWAGRNCSVRLRVAELDSRFPGFVAALTSPSALADVNAG